MDEASKNVIKEVPKKKKNEKGIEDLKINSMKTTSHRQSTDDTNLLEDYIRINDPIALSNLGHVDHVVMDKTGTITRPNFTLSHLYVNGKVYTFPDDVIKRLTQKYNEKNRTSLSNYINEHMEGGIYQSPTLKSNTVEDIPANSLSEQRLDELVENDKNFAKTREFASFSGKNKLSAEKYKLLSSPESLPLNIPPNLTNNVNTVTTNNANTTGGPLIDHSPLATTKNKSKFGEFDLRNSYISPVTENMIGKEKDFYKDLIKRETPIDEFMRSLILCHRCRVRYENAETKYFESHRKEEETVLEFAKCCSYLFEQSNKYENPDLYSLIMNGNKSNYEIYGINEFSYQRKRFSIVVKNTHEETATIYCKGPLESVRGILELDKEEMEGLDSILKYFKDNGLKCVLYAKKRLEKTVAESFKSNFHNLKYSLMSQTKELDDLAITMETKMDLIGVIGLKEEIRGESQELIKFFDGLNLPCWMLTGDNEENAMNCAFTSKLIHNTKEPMVIKDDNTDDLFLTIRNLLSEVKLIIDPYKKNIDENIQEKVSPTKRRILKRLTTGIGSTRFAISIDIKQLLWNKYIIVSGTSLNLIMNDPYLKSHFIFLLAMPKVVIAYGLTPYQKGEFVKIIQDYFENKTVLAIGDGFNDNIMMQLADVSMEIVHLKGKLENHIRNNAGDIQINSLKHVKDLMLMEGKSFFERLDNVVLFLFYKEYLLAFPLFFFNWYSSFTGTKIFESIFVFLYQFIFSSLTIVIYGALDKPFKPEVVKRFTGLYLDGAHKKLNAVTRFFIRGVLEAVFQSVIIFYFTNYMVMQSVSQDGFGVDIGVFSVILAAAVLFIHNFKISFICSNHKVLKGWIGFFFAIGLYICYIFANDFRDLEGINFRLEYSEVFSRATPLISLAYIIWMSLLFGYLCHRYLYRLGAPTINEYYESRNEGFLRNNK